MLFSLYDTCNFFYARIFNTSFTSVDFISSNPECTVISEWNNTEDEEAKNKSAIVLATGSPYQNNEGPLQRDEVKATFNKEESKDNTCKSTLRFFHCYSGKLRL